MMDQLLSEVQAALRPEALRAADPNMADRLEGIQAAATWLFGHLQAISTPDAVQRQAGVTALQAAWAVEDEHRVALGDAERILASSPPGGAVVAELLRALREALDGPPLTEAALGEALEGPLDVAREVGLRVRQDLAAKQIRTSVDQHLAGFTLPFRGVT